MDTNLIEILKKKALNITAPRLNILALFYEHTGCLSHDDVSKALGGVIDRVTIYRTLRAFVRKEILYCIPTVNNHLLYSLQMTGTPHHTPVQHALFICEQCRRVYPMDSIDLGLQKMPGNFVIHHCSVVINGKCKDC
jgi:Fur family ferric uptake transcriptional regulator